MRADWRQDGVRRARAAQVDLTLASSARAGDYLDGGRNNFEADRKAARMLVAAAPVIGQMMPARRAFHRRAVRFLAAEAGVRQFLDIGTGLVASGRTHQEAWSVDPGCRVVYVDNDPMVLTHSRAILDSAPDGTLACVDADASDPHAIVEGARTIVDFSRPVAVLLLSTLAYISAITAEEVMSVLVGAVPPGSYFALYYPANDLDPTVPRAIRQWNRLSTERITLRSRDEFARLVAGLDLIPPGIVSICDWRPAPEDPAGPMIPLHAVVARKP